MSLARIKKGDLVEVIAGKDRGKQGKVISILFDKGRVLVEKLNLIKRHTKPTQKNPQGGIVEKEAGIHLSNVMPVCPKTNKPARVGVKTVKGDKVRVSRPGNETIEVKV